MGLWLVAQVIIAVSSKFALRGGPLAFKPFKEDLTLYPTCNWTNWRLPRTVLPKVYHLSIKVLLPLWTIASAGPRLTSNSFSRCGSGDPTDKSESWQHRRIYNFAEMHARSVERTRLGAGRVPVASSLFLVPS